MRHPLHAVPADRRRTLWIDALIVTVGVGVLLGVADQQLSRGGGEGIIPFELAGSAERAVEITDRWRDNDALDAAGFSLGLDYLYMALYAITLAGAALGVGARAATRGMRGVARLAEPLAWAAFAAAALDAVENACLYKALNDPAGSDGAMSVAMVAASVKFVLLAAVILYAVVGGLLTLRSQPASAPSR